MARHGYTIHPERSAEIMRRSKRHRDFPLVSVSTQWTNTKNKPDVSYTLSHIPNRAFREVVSIWPVYVTYSERWSNFHRPGSRCKRNIKHNVFTGRPLNTRGRSWALNVLNHPSMSIGVGSDRRIGQTTPRKTPEEPGVPTSGEPPDIRLMEIDTHPGDARGTRRRIKGASPHLTCAAFRSFNRKHTRSDRSQKVRR
jgi:hypothetical protein